MNFIKDHDENRASLAIAAPQAARARFRAIFITTLTNVAGMFPPTAETSLQPQMLILMVASLVPIDIDRWHGAANWYSNAIQQTHHGWR